MLFVALGKAKPGTMGERSAHHTAWQYPADTGAEVLAEYWLQTLDPHLIAVVKSGSHRAVVADTPRVGCVFEFTVYPSITASRGA